VSKPLEIERRIAELDSGAAKTVPWEEVRRRNSRSFHVAGKKIEFHDEAAAEYGASFDWYLGRSPDAARNFDSAVEDALSHIRRAPLRWASGPFNTRRYLLQRFPFLTDARCVG